MPSIPVVFFEPGIPEHIPGIAENTPALFFPFWADYSFLELHLANFSSVENSRFIFILQKKQRKLEFKLATNLKIKNTEIIVLENGIYSLLEILNSLKADICFFVSLACLALFKFPRFLTVGTGNGIIKLSVNSVPLDIYVVKRRQIISYLHSNLNQYTSETDCASFLFSQILSNYEQIREVPGKICFYNRLYQFYENNLWLIHNQCQQEPSLPKITSLIDENSHSNSYIGPQAYVKNSILGAGVEVFGIVQNSVLFTDTVIAEGAMINDAVIMNNNRIGENCRISNAIIFPYFDETQNNDYNIGENAIIGGNFTNTKNMLFPEQIRNGLCVVGMNSLVPQNFSMEAASYLVANTAEKILRNVMKLEKGATLGGGINT